MCQVNFIKYYAKALISMSEKVLLKFIESSCMGENKRNFGVEGGEIILQTDILL